MQFVMDFDICAALFLTIIGFNYYYQKSVPTLQNRMYGLQIIIVNFAILFDISTVIANDKKDILPIWSLYVLNMLFLLSVSAVAALFMIYVIILTGLDKKKMMKIHKTIIGFPALIPMIAVLLTPINHLIFYIDPVKGYTLGPLHKILYIPIAYYLIVSIFFVFKFHKLLGKRKFFTILSSISIFIIAMVVQIVFPNLLVFGVASALVLTLFYHALQGPSHEIDSLTSLYNRSTLFPLLNDYYNRLTPFSMIVFAVDEFKLINSVLGIKNGDILLRQIAEYLTESYPAHHILRLDGDQFALIIQNEIIDFELLQKIGTDFPNKWNINGSEIKLTACILGISGLEHETIEELMTTVDYALSYVKNEGKGIVHLIDDELKEKSLYSIKIKKALKSALEEERLEVYYQPIFSRRRNGVFAAEALARLTDPDLGVVSPDIFIKVAEQNGLINQVGEMILESVCKFLQQNDISKWGIDHIDVNLSVIQCMQDDLVERVFSILDKYQIPPNQIAFEITESAAAASFDTLVMNIEEIAKRGIRFSLDDFGTGFSNLDYIVKLPFESVKLDKNMLWSAIQNEKKTIFLKNLSVLIHNMGLSVICEGAETREHIQFLKEVNINCIQGYFYSKPLPELQFIEYMNQNIQMERLDEE